MCVTLSALMRILKFDTYTVLNSPRALPPMYISNDSQTNMCVCVGCAFFMMLDSDWSSTQRVFSEFDNCDEIMPRHVCAWFTGTAQMLRAILVTHSCCRVFCSNCTLKCGNVNITLIIISNAILLWVGLQIYLTLYSVASHNPCAWVAIHFQFSILCTHLLLWVTYFTIICQAMRL